MSESVAACNSERSDTRTRARVMALTARNCKLSIRPDRARPFTVAARMSSAATIRGDRAPSRVHNRGALLFAGLLHTLPADAAIIWAPGPGPVVRSWSSSGVGSRHSAFPLAVDTPLSQARNDIASVPQTPVAAFVALGSA